MIFLYIFKIFFTMLHLKIFLEYWIILYIFRISLCVMSPLRKGVLKTCSKFTQPCRSTISIKLLCNFIEIALTHGCSPINLLQIFRTPFLKVAPRVEKNEVFKKCWDFANWTYFASCIMKKYCFLLWTKETAFFPYFYHEIFFYSAELFDFAVNFKFYLNICIFLKGVCVPRTSALDPQNIARTNLWIKHITYSRSHLFKIKTLYLFKIFKKLFRKAKLWCPK